MAHATDSDPRIAPDRAGFSTALAAARDQGGRIIDRTTYQATIAIDILTPTSATAAEDP